MERKGNTPDIERHSHAARRSAMPTWQDAVRRGSIIGCVLAGHIVILMAVLHPSWQKIERVAHQQEDHVLRLSFDPAQKISQLVPARAATRMPTKAKPTRQTTLPPTVISAAVHQTNAPSSTANSVIMTTPQVADELNRSYQPGDFQAALQNAQRTRADHIPGDATLLIGGIQLQASTSAQHTFHRLVATSRCTNMQLDLQNSAHRFTPAMIDRVLQTSGCGPHLERSAADAAIKDIAHQAIFGN